MDELDDIFPSLSLNDLHDDVTLICYLLSVICCLLFVVFYLLSVICCLLFDVCYLLSVTCCL